ncbi:hypothetical protein OAA09_00530 [bacterium]|nr:hypothetical protein [bacterium]
MYLHETVIEKLIKLCDNYGGHREQIKLRAELRKLSLSEYNQQETGKKVLVLTTALEKALSDYSKA